jgi:dephospho-CoA kinase
MILGVTGGIAAGKSTVTEILRSLGAVVVSADELAREVVRPGTPTLKRLVDCFGETILKTDGTLDRKALGRKVFSDPEARRRVNRIVHPAIADLAERRLAELSAGGAELIVYEAPLLFEAGAEERVEAVLVVRVEESLQLARLMARDGLSRSEAESRIAAQMSQEEKVARADYVIDNSGTREEVESRIRTLLAGLGLPGSEGAPGR